MKIDRHPFFAEIIESNLNEFRALCWQWNQAEPIGSLITIESKTHTTFALISSLQEGSSDPTRTPYAYQKTESELRRDHPHIFEFLQTTLSGKILGFCTSAQQFFAHIPPQPPALHAFVRPATEAEKKLIKKTPYFLYRLCADLPPATADELILACIYHDIKQGVNTPEQLDFYSKACANIIQNDYARLRQLLQRMESFVAL